MDLNQIIALYSDPLYFQLAVVSPLLGVAAFLLFALPWTWLAYKDPASLRPYRIQNKTINVSRWFWPTMGRIAVNSVGLMLLITLAWPVLSHSGLQTGPNWPAWYVVAAQLAAFIFIDDFLYYWMHRAFHTRWLYKHIHSVHHRPVTPCAITGNYFHFGEYVATTSLLLVGPLLFQSHVVTLYVWVIFRQLEAADGHSGYDVPWNPLNWFPLYHGPAYHDFHHKAFHGNYSGFLNYLDSFFGRFSKGYELYREEQKKGRGNRSATGSRINALKSKQPADSQV